MRRSWLCAGQRAYGVAIRLLTFEANAISSWYEVCGTLWESVQAVGRGRGRTVVVIIEKCVGGEMQP